MATTDSALSTDRHYTTLGVAQATGIPATTILAWERRYGLPRPDRDAAGRRRYSQADVELVLAMRARTADGVRAETAARELRAGPDAPLPPRPALVYLPTEVKEIQCLHCGTSSGELQVQRGAQGMHTRFVPALGAALPRRGPGAQPLCGRCNGALLAEPLGQRNLPPFGRAATPRLEQGAA
ncbi:MAG TPA: MerR family transcriptional regulator [Chloroflexota bacterium]|nr:MerR family transcriptional regulator [Chloroflexota bacterium]